MKPIALIFLFLVLAPDSRTQISRNHPSVHVLCNKIWNMLNEGKYQQAFTLANQAIQLDSRSAEAQAAFGQCEFVLGNWSDAKRHLGEAIRVDKKLTIAHETLGDVYLMEKQYEAAEKEFVIALSLQPHNFPCLYGLGLSLLSQDYPSFALNLSRAKRLPPSDPRVLTAIMVAHLKLGEMEKARAELKELDRILAHDFPRQVQLAALLVERGAYDLAIDQFKHLLELRPYSYELNYDLALAYHRAARNDEAAAQIHKLLGHGHDAELRNLLGAIEDARGHFLKALAAYQEAVRLDPGNEEYQLDYATAIALHVNPMEALKVFAAALQKFPRSARLWTSLGGCYYLIGMYKQAAASLLKASYLAPDDPKAYALLNLSYESAGPLRTEIEQRFESYVNAHPENAWAHYYYGKILLERAKNSGAIAEADIAQRELCKSIDLDPALAQSRIQLAELLRMRGDINAARTQLETAVKFEPSSRDAWYQLMQVYTKLHMPEKASAALQRFREHGGESGSNTESKQVLKLLTSGRQ